MEAYGGFGAFAEHMTSELKVATVLDQFFLREKVERLATPGQTSMASRPARDVGSSSPLCPPSLTRALLWASIAHEEVVSSEFEDKLGIWTSLIDLQPSARVHPVSALRSRSMGYLFFMLPVDVAGGDNPRGDKTWRLMCLRSRHQILS